MLVKNAYELFLILQEKGIQLRLDHEQNLKCQAPKGVMTEALLLALKEHKADLIRIMKHQAISHLDTMLASSKMMANGERVANSENNFSEPLETIQAPESLLIDGRYPLSTAEKRFWFLHTLSETPHHYNVHVSYSVLGDLDIQALEQAVSRVMNRHAILRTSFEAHQGEICRWLQHSASFKVSVFSFLDQTENQWMDTLVQRQQIAFDLFSFPLFRVDFLVNQQTSTKVKNQCLLFCLHHLICDAWSIEILLKEIFSYYIEYTQGVKTLLPEVSLQYIDYALWQDDQILKQKEALAFWCLQLQAIENILEEADAVAHQSLSSSQPLSSVQSLSSSQAVSSSQYFSSSEIVNVNHKKNIHLFVLCQSDYEKILAFSKAHQISIFNFLLFSYGLFIYYTFGKKCFAVGVPVTTRNRKAAENIMGCLINTVAMKFSIDETLTFTEFFIKMKKDWSILMPYQAVPFEKIVEAIEFGDRDQKNTYPIFQTLLAYHKNDSVDTLECQGLSLSKMPSLMGVAKVPVQLTLTETTSNIQCEWEWNQAFFNEENILRWTQSFQSLIRLIVDSATIQIKDCQLFKLQRKPAMLIGIERRNFYQKLAPYLFKDWYIFEKNIAIVQGTHKITYQELFFFSEVLLKKFFSKISVGDTVAMWCSLSIESIAALLALVRAGGIYIPMHIDWPLERVQKALKTANAQYVCVEKTLQSKITHDFLALPSTAIIQIPSFDQLRGDIENEKLNAEKDEDFSYISEINEKSLRSILYVIFTSGSTGDAKGALVYQDSFINLLQWYIETLCLNAQDRTLVFTSFAFDLTQKNIWATLTVGATLYLPLLHYFVADVCCDIIFQEKITRVNSSPSLFYAILEKASQSGSAEELLSPLFSLQSVVLGGEAIQYPLLEQWHATHTATHLYNSYGPTECTDVVTCVLIPRCPSKVLNKPIPLGLPVFNTVISIRDSLNQVMYDRQVGEICISGIPLGAGYIARDDLTKQVFLSPDVETFYKTGDFGYIAEDGLLYFSGRRDDQIKLRGLRIELSEIELAILSFNIPCAVFCWQETLVAFVVEKSSFSTQKFRQQLLQKLPLYSIPEVFFILDQLPLTTSGKVDRILLKKLYEGRLKEEMVSSETLLSSEGGGAPETVLSSEMMPEPKISHFSSEKMVLKNVLLRIWGSILKKKIHEQHSFFQQGGHSLLALNLLYQIQNEWSLQLHLSDLLIYDSIVLQTDWLYQKINQNKSSSNIYILKEYPEEPTYDWVLIHPILGDLACYAYWVKQCSDAAQVMGVSCPHHIENYANANDLLVEYADAIIKQLKTNRVRLLGYSFGGMLAVLLAPFLSKKEISVEWVGIIDSDLSTDFSDLLSKSAYSLDTNNMHAEVIEHFYQKAKERGVIDYDYPYHAFQSRALSMYHLYRLFSGVSLKPLETPWFMVLGLKTHQVSMMQYSPFLAAPTLILEATHADMLSEINSQKILDFIATL